jgi:hypothetical protein
VSDFQIPVLPQNGRDATVQVLVDDYNLKLFARLPVETCQETPKLDRAIYSGYNKRYHSPSRLSNVVRLRTPLALCDQTGKPLACTTTGDRVEE